MKRLLATLSFCALLPLNAATVVFDQTNVTILGTDVFTPLQLTVVGNFLSTDSLLAQGDGEVGLAGISFYANAAGVITRPPVTNTGHTPGACAPSGGFCYAAVLIGNPGAGIAYTQLFAFDASNGAGDATPSTVVSNNRTLQDMFGQGLSDGAQLFLKINDINNGDNSGAFRLEFGAEPIPEPSTYVLMGAGLAALGFLRRRR